MPFLVMEDVSKRFGGVRALQGASLQVNAGEVHGLLGANGSGKSTLNKVLSGTVNPDQATISIAGQPVRITRPIDAHRHHVASVYQQLSLVPELSIADNLLLGTEISRAGFVDQKKSRQYAEEALAHFLPGMDDGVTLNTEVGDLSPGSQQLVEVAKAVARRPRILVLDEATASLRRDQVELVFSMVRQLVDEGVAVVFVSHRLEEVRQICQRATILRNGKTVASVDMQDMSEARLVRLMVGDLVEEEVEGTEQTKRAALSEEVQLETRNLHSATLRGINLDARKGEVVGLGGLQGQGQSELLHVLFGDIPKTSGEVKIAGETQNYRGPRGGISAGVALVPGDRGSQGLLMKRPILENLSIISGRKRLMAKWFVNIGREKQAAGAEVDRLQIKIGSLRDAVSTLSGGNQQKIVLGKWLMNDPRVVLLDDPTKGVDVGAKAEIYEIIRTLAASGVTVILNSSDDQELVALCDRVFVLYEGEVVTVLNGSEVTQDNLVSAALLFGTTEPAATEGGQR
ncbi:sugar ABC transporter ATP-binding protein [Actinomyces minihominis]|uniref:sugar ABC transporter ATP-binding protein n=1 Tax=Actinomyces minihominis TaxID=2002838 RepID=UPI000C069045|nr:sugar ABC transporter ATP-binding protein [Actinomyces minihominis]